MKTQTVVFTPNIELATTQALERIKTLLPEEVIYHLNASLNNGNRSTQFFNDGNTHTVITQWKDSAAEEHKAMMANVSENVKSQLISEGWLITFTPETVDL